MENSNLKSVANVSIPLWFDYNSGMPTKENLKDTTSQFHYGSITTVIVVVDMGKKVILSQFHYGSITTPQQFAGIIIGKGGLNSTMVRLQLYQNY